MARFVALASILLTFGCGSDDTGAPRPLVDGGGGGTSDTGAGLPCELLPCGGEIIGTWKNEKVCSDVDVFGEVDIETYFADGKYESTNKDGILPRTGTWIATGTEVTITLSGGDGGNKYTTDYCVKDDVLWARYTPTTVIVLVKQP